MVIMVVVRSMRITAGGVRAILESYVRNSQAGLVHLVNISKRVRQNTQRSKGSC
nr:MAG TPA: hypothetical protein [Caudoviricetes sp.]